MRNRVEKIAVLTSGGDAPGMNAAIRAVVRTAAGRGVKVLGIRKGYTGIFEGDMVEMTAESVSGIIMRGGTILYTARNKEMLTEEGQKKAAEIIKSKGIDGLIVIGGDGSYKGAQALSRNGINVMGIPGTIDLDIASTRYTIGFDTAVNTAVEAIDRIKDTSASHERVSIIEVMGRSAGYIALESGIATGAESILIPESKGYDENEIIEAVIDNRKRGHTHHIIINAEGIGDSVGMAKRIEAATGIETRATVLGYLQRGGNPTCRDRVMASVMGEMAVRLLCEGKKNRIIAYRESEYTDIDIDEALAMEKQIPEYMLNVAETLTYHYTKINGI